MAALEAAPAVAGAVGKVAESEAGTQLAGGYAEQLKATAETQKALGASVGQVSSDVAKTYGAALSVPQAAAGRLAGLIKGNPPRVSTASLGTARKTVAALGTLWDTNTDEGARRALLDYTNAKANPPLKRTTKTNRNAVARLYREFFANHTMPLSNPPKEDEVDHLKEWSWVPEPKPKETPVATTAPAAATDVATAIINPPEPTEAVKCTHAHLITIGEGVSKNPGGQKMTVFRCLDCKKTFARRK